jgi:hypothetical protein
MSRLTARTAALASAVVLAVTALGGAASADQPGQSQPTADFALTAPLTAAPQCTLTVPRDPLSAEGLATPYVLSSAATACSEMDQGTAAFVQATVYSPSTGQLSVYDPVVVSTGQQPPVVPPVPRLRHGDVVSIWTGFNGNVLKLTGPGAGSFVNFAQQSYAGSVPFFRALNAAVQRGQVTVPAPGTSTADHMPCPTTRDFSVVDQDPSDNVPVTYAFDNGVSNGSDEHLLNFLQQALGCAEWQVPSLDPAVSGAATSPSGALQEAQAAYWQAAPVALVPGSDEFVTNNGNFVAPAGNGVPNLPLDDLYRAQVDQPFTLNDQDTAAWCGELSRTGAVRLAADAAIENKFPAPGFAMIGNSLALVLAGRFSLTWMLLGCPALTGQPSPITPTADGAGIVVSAAYPGGVTVSAAQPVPGAAAPAPAPPAAPATPATGTPTDMPT